MNTDVYRKKLDRLLVQFRQAREQAQQEQQHLDEAREQVEHLLQAQAIVQQVAEAVQQQAHEQVARMVTRCLQAVFGEEAAYTFKIDFERKRGRTEARLLFCRDGMELEPLGAAGGGVIDVAAFALRLACLVLARPKRRRLLVLDEPWKHLSAEYRPAVRQLVLTLARELGIQFLICTHANELKIGKVIEL